MGRRVLLPMMMMLVCVLAFPLAIHADSGLAQYPTDGYVVEDKDDGTVKIVNLKPDKIPNTPYEMTIPETINGKSVSEISRIGNYRCGGTQLKEVTIPSSVTVIGGDHANSLFQDCTALEKVTLYDTIECFGYHTIVAAAISISASAPPVRCKTVFKTIIRTLSVARIINGESPIAIILTISDFE